MFYRWFFCIFLVLNGTLAIGSEKFSESAWRKIDEIYAAIVKHPFNQELMRGTLSKKIFTYYSEQDSLYLIDFSRSLKSLATKLNDHSDIEKLIQLARESEVEEKNAHSKNVAIETLTVAAPATRLYTDYLLMVASYKTKEELVAALLPCFWIYLKLAEDLKPQVNDSNPYFKWVQTYSSPKYRQSVNFMIDLSNKLADATTASNRSKMLDAFVLASRMEWYFWDGSYKMESWKP